MAGRSKWMRWVPAVVWMAVIFTASSIPGKDIPGGYSVYGHLAEYAILGGLLLFAMAGFPSLRIAALLALAAASAYGVTDELHQFLTPGRTPDPVDWATDTVGAAVGIAVVLLAWRMMRRRRDQ